MKSSKLLKEIIDHLDNFDHEAGAGEPSLTEFLRYLNKQSIDKENISDKRFGTAAPEAQKNAFETENTIARLLTYMSRYSRHYIKKALEGSMLQSPEEFSYLAILLTHQSMTKTELIHMNLQEKTTGTEIIRRLISSGLVLQVSGENDKRSKKLSITEAGKKIFYAIASDMSNVSKMISGNLSVSEKEVLLDILIKLEGFHQPIFESKSILSKTDLNNWVENL